MGFSFMVSDAEIEAKYKSGKYSLIQKCERIKLPRVAETIRFNPNYMTLDTEESSSWDVIKQSRLIESLIINIPVPPIVLYEKSYGSYIVIDGKQRLKAIADFYSNKLTLTGLEVETELNGRTYVTLPTLVRAVLDRKSLSFITVMTETGSNPLEIARLIEVVAERFGNKKSAGTL